MIPHRPSHSRPPQASTLSRQAPLKGAIPMLSEGEYRQLKLLVHQHLGIYWKEDKKELIYTRLNKRLRSLDLNDFTAYYKYLLQEEHRPELQVMLNAVTINKTEFFRNGTQLNFLTSEILPQIRRNLLKTQSHKLRIWSAGCSTGEEAYTLAMLAHEHLGPLGMGGLDLRILASDVNTKVVEFAKTATYIADLIQPVPDAWLKKYFLRRELEGSILYQATDKLRELIQFRTFNLLDKQYPIKTKFSLIFCRNVLIYFDHNTRQGILRRLSEFLHPGGYLLLGFSEYIQDIPGFRRMKNNVYQRSPRVG
ncbi:MAG: chemotaxis protein CheR [SAR324 cluster bacterium]|uniref:protein-glutamate O-methyltransferase n=1 Tax=SAR324 cluster bacterium TaxID=2024889 RepID=A0A2A4SLY9_9DELT|nr:MAG: chemotaxis protein CheR [SAR324 cluster bacterium]